MSCGRYGDESDLRGTKLKPIKRPEKQIESLQHTPQISPTNKSTDNGYGAFEFPNYNEEAKNSSNLAGG